MAFFLQGVEMNGVMVVGTRDGVSKANKPFASLTVADDAGNVNTFSTSDPMHINELHALQRGDMVDLTLVAAAGPEKQYCMIANEPGSVRVHDGASGVGTAY